MAGTWAQVAGVPYLAHWDGLPGLRLPGSHEYIVCGLGMAVTLAGVQFMLGCHGGDVVELSGGLCLLG